MPRPHCPRQQQRQQWRQQERQQNERGQIKATSRPATAARRSRQRRPLGQALCPGCRHAGGAAIRPAGGTLQQRQRRTAGARRQHAPPQIDSSSSDGGSNLHAQFHPEATEAQIRAWLLREGLQIVDGPDAANRYTLHAGDAQRTLPVPGPGNPLARRDP